MNRPYLVFLVLLTGCTTTVVDTSSPGTDGVDDDTDPFEQADPERDTDIDTEPLPEVDEQCDDTLIVVVGTDPWGETAGVGEQVLGVSGRSWDAGRAWWSSDTSEPVDVLLSGSEWVDTTVSVRWNGTTLDVVGGADRSRWAVTSSVQDVDGLDCSTLTVWVGLDHRWFAPSARPPSLNGVDVLFDGEEGWEAVYDAVADAEERVTWSTWYWESDFELLRPPGHESMSEAERRPYTALGALEQANVDTRVLINRFWGENLDFTAYINTDGPLRDYAQQANDGVEIILQGNESEVPVDGTFDARPEPYPFMDRILSTRPAQRFAQADLARRRGFLEDVDAASWHQKGIVVDGRVAFVSGMNTKGADWDTVEHLVYESRRMPFDAAEDDRLEVLLREEETDLGPRKDYSVRVEGPAAADVERYFRIRWADSLRDGMLYSENATPLPALPTIASPPVSVPVQVVATQPDPRLEQSLLETHLRAIEQAEDYVLIEDQFFRAPILADALEERMWADPDLVLMVITNPVSYLDPARRWTLDNHDRFTPFGDRYVWVQLISTDLYTDVGVIWDTVEVVEAPIFNHSKLRLVDDTYLSIGSGNFNNRGYKYEGELSVAIVDEDIATDTRERLLSQIVGPFYSRFLSDDAQNNADVLALASQDNASVMAWWRDEGEDLDVDQAIAEWEDYQPSGWAFPLDFGDDYFWDVGPDLF